MKPTLEALLILFRRHPGAWLNHAIVYEAGGHRTTARVMELRQLGHRISQRGQGEGSQYRYDGPPSSPYEHFSCVCSWKGFEPQAMRGIGGYLCPSCGRAVEQAEKVAQVALL